MKNPTAVAALDLIRKHDGGPVCYDHFAFRTFGVSLIMFQHLRFMMCIFTLLLSFQEWPGPFVFGNVYTAHSRVVLACN